jgi:hypothetical protein
VVAAGSPRVDRSLYEMYIVDMTSQCSVVYLYILKAAIKTGMIDRVSSKGGIDVQGAHDKG